MKQHTTLFTLLFSLFTTLSFGQQCHDYACVIAKVEKLLKQTQKDYGLILDNLDSAEGYPNSKPEQIRKLRRRVFGAIENERKEAVKQKQITEQKSNELEKANAKNQKIIKALYFHKDKYALVYQKAEQFVYLVDGSGSYLVDGSDRALGELGTKQGFYFIDKEGNPSLKDEMFVIAFPFDESIDLARVKVNDTDSSYCFLDTLGQTYPLATNPKQLNSDITAVDLTGLQLENLPSNIFENVQLKILILRFNSLTILDLNIPKLTNLIKLDLRKNKISQLPNEIAELKNLQVLYLQGNPIPPKEQEKIKKLLPNCKIEF